MPSRPSSPIDKPLAAELVGLCADIVDIEAREVAAITERISPSLCQALSLLKLGEGRIIVIGIGKSGHVGRKIAATLSSTGSPAFFVHATEACHGDSGIISANDTILAISQSGESEEFLALLPLIRALGVPIVAITAKTDSALGENSDVVLSSDVEREACPHNLAPTSSTTVALVIGDALAMCLLKLNGFTAEDFARSHPAGSLGRRLLLRVRDAMISGERAPRVSPETMLSEAILEMSDKGLGMTAVVDGDDRIVGVFTDGDLRRSLQEKVDVHTTAISERMTRGFRTIDADQPAVAAVPIMEESLITALLVPDADRRLAGVLTMRALIQLRLV